MPVRKVKLKDETVGYQWGTTGKIYRKREDAEKQGLAILLSQRKKRKMKFNKELYNELKEKVDSLEKLVNGGKGSGNFGHSGRPGKVGGSSSVGFSSGQNAEMTTAYGEELGVKIVRKLSDKEKRDRAFLANPDVDYYQVETPDGGKSIVWEGRLKHIDTKEKDETSEVDEALKGLKKFEKVFEGDDFNILAKVYDVDKDVKLAKKLGKVEEAEAAAAKEFYKIFNPKKMGVAQYMRMDDFEYTGTRLGETGVEAALKIRKAYLKALR